MGQCEEKALSVEYCGIFSSVYMANIFHFVFNTFNYLTFDCSKYIMILTDTGGEIYLCFT